MRDDDRDRADRILEYLTGLAFVAIVGLAVYALLDALLLIQGEVAFR